MWTLSLFLFKKIIKPQYYRTVIINQIKFIIMSKYTTLIKNKESKKSKKDITLLESNAIISCKEQALKLEKQINSLKASIAKGKEADHFDAEDVVYDIMSLKVAESRLKVLVALQKELF
jgi:hypothetical protein